MIRVRLSLMTTLLLLSLAGCGTMYTTDKCLPQELGPSDDVIITEAVLASQDTVQFDRDGAMLDRERGRIRGVTNEGQPVTIMLEDVLYMNVRKVDRRATADDEQAVLLLAGIVTIAICNLIILAVK